MDPSIEERKRVERERAQRVRELRDALGLTQEELAGLCGLLRTDIVLIETVRNKMGSFDKRKKLAKGFGLSLDWFDAYLDGQLALADALARSSREPREKARKRAVGES
jgi:transcriptional regulator with XRE-family HTH domain